MALPDHLKGDSASLTLLEAKEHCSLTTGQMLARFIVVVPFVIDGAATTHGINIRFILAE
jgi:hypothetical protein